MARRLKSTVVQTARVEQTLKKNVGASRVLLDKAPEQVTGLASSSNNGLGLNRSVARTKKKNILQNRA